MREVNGTYKGERYLARDNGEVLRHPPIGKQPRPTDNKWTFGKPNDKTGYVEIAGIPVHIIVATAFLGNAQLNNTLLITSTQISEIIDQRTSGGLPDWKT